MNRHVIKPRKYLHDILIESHDLKTFNNWKENCFYSLTYKEYNFIEKTVIEVSETLEYYYKYIIRKNLLESLNLLDKASRIEESVSSYNENLIERLDFYYDGKNMLLYEINCEFYNCLYECTEVVAQWQRTQCKGNSVMVVNNVRPQIQQYLEKSYIDNIDIIGSIDYPERFNIGRYIYSIFLSCGIKATMLHNNAVQLENGYVIDIKNNRRISNIYKLFTWWDTTNSLTASFLTNKVNILEPYHIIAKQNKALLAFIHLYTKSAPIIPTAYLPKKMLTISKPLNYHSGNKVKLHTKNDNKKLDLIKDSIYQNYYPPYKTEENTYMVLECWVINKKLSAIGFRESYDLINCSGNGFIVPYIIY